MSRANESMRLRDFFSSAALSVPLGRRQYVTAGLTLMAIKYAVDALVIYGVTGIVWTPLDYFVPLTSIVGEKVGQFPSWLNIALLVWTAPFIWMGVTLSVRRALSARISPWWVVAFFLPVLNYAFMATLALAPERFRAPAAAPVQQGAGRLSPGTSFIAAAAAGAAAGLALVALGVLAIGSYGVSLFAGTPFAVGIVSGFVHARLNPHSVFRSVAAGVVSSLVLGVMLLSVAVEGAVCLVMAIPIAVPVVVLGAVIGDRLGRPAAVSIMGMGVVLLLPPIGSVIDASMDTPPERVVLSSVEIDAPPDRVWPHVVQFGEIEESPRWYFRFGLAYPLRARMVGQGPGAVRYCEFTTGHFREPITAWEAPVRLAFDVASQPPPLEEWSPYTRVYAPHQQNYFRTTRGEFRLVLLPGGRTRLEGRTWYTLRIYPTAYWTVLSDRIVHDIHARVLQHIKRHVG